MAKTKYIQFYDLMIEDNQELFADFKKVHDAYAAGDQSQEEPFHELGRKLVDKIRDWERRLCSGMNRGQYAQYSIKLSDKYWERVRKDLPLIDEVGVRKK